MTLDQVKTKLDEHGINKIKLGGFDIDGVLRGKYISLEKFSPRPKRASVFVM